MSVVCICDVRSYSYIRCQLSVFLLLIRYFYNRCHLSVFVLLSNSRLSLKLRVDFVLPLSQQEEEQEEQHPTKIYTTGLEFGLW